MDSAFLKLTGIVLIMILWGCTPQATPIAPVLVSTPAEAAVATSQPFLRYAIAPDLMRWLPESVRDMRLLIEPYTATGTTENYDLIVAYGIYAGWQTSENYHQVSLLIHSEHPPLNQPAIRDLLVSALNLPQIAAQIPISGVQPAAGTVDQSPAQIREQLANLGYPDGIYFTIVSSNPVAAEALATVLQQAGFQVTPIIRAEEIVQEQFFTGRAASALVTTPTETSATDASEFDTYPLYTIPISYWSRDGLSVIFSENGIPLPAR